MLSNLVISDTSSIILLDKIDEIDILRQSFDLVYTTPIVAREFGVRLPEWLQVREVTDKAYQARLDALMDAGEASVLALAAELDDCYILIDDNRARRYAQAIGQKFLGTLGLILRAKQIGIITAVRPMIEKVRLTDFRATDGLYEFIIKEAGE